MNFQIRNRFFLTLKKLSVDSDIVGEVKKFFGSKKKRAGRVDPYVSISFAGSKVKSQVVRKNDNPEFNEELHLPISVSTR